MQTITPIQLTPRQRQILQAISVSQSNHCYSPTMAELSRQLGISRSTVFEHLSELKLKGFISTCPGKARSSRLTSHAQELLELEEEPFSESVPPIEGLPLVGQVAAGLPLDAIEQHETLSWHGVFGHSHDLFSLQVKGDSMIEENINPGDYVICRRTPTARDGDLVVALVDDNEATLKRFYRESNRVRLEPANVNYAPIYSANCRIAAIVVGLLRQF